MPASLSRARLRCPTLLLLSLLALLPCSTALAADKADALAPAELDALEAIARRIAESGPDALPALVVEALAATELGHDAKCRKAIGEAARGAAEVRAMAALNAVEVCKLPAWESFGRAVNKKGTLAADAAFVAACDEKGKDTLFIGPLAPLRAEMEPGHYLLLRQLLPELRTALQKDGSPRARAVWATIDRYLPSLAVQLVAIDRVAHPLPSASPPPPFERPRDMDKRELRRPGAPLVAISAGTITVDGIDVGRVDALLKKKDAEGWKMTSLGNRLERWRKEFIEHHAGAPTRDRFVLRPDLDTTYEVLARIYYAAAQLGFTQIDFAVPLRDRGFHHVRWSGQVPAPLVVAMPPEPARVEWDDAGERHGNDKVEPPTPSAAPSVRSDKKAAGPELSVEVGGFVLKNHVGAEQKVPDVDAKPDEEGLRKALAWLRKGHGAELLVTVEDEVRYRRLVWTIDMAREAGFDRAHLAVEEPPPLPPELGPSPEPMPSMAASDPHTSADLGDLSSLGMGGEAPKGPVPVVEAEAVKIEGGLAADAVGKAIGAHLEELKRCYAVEASRKRGLSGRVVLQLLVSGGGAVQKALVSSSTINNPGFESCAVQAAQAWRFPMPDGGVAVIVTAPFALRLAKR